jgi:indolepyruvate ferredoxin oxidoreductase beta subunit
LKTTRVVIAGVGGQGTLLASRLIAEAAMSRGLNVRIGETYGMAQRGGPVMGHIQIGEAFSPQIRLGEADAILGFELAEAARRGVTYLRVGGLSIVNDRKIPPVEVISGARGYPSDEELLGLLRKVAGKIVIFDAESLAIKAGAAIATNMVMLGALMASDVLPIGEAEILVEMRKSIPERFLGPNERALQLGAEAYRNQR